MLAQKQLFVLTRTVIKHKLHVQLLSTYRRQQIVKRFAGTLTKENDPLHTNLLNDSVQHFANEEPTKEALLLCDNKTNECQKFTFNDIHQQACRWVNALTDKIFGIKKGQTVLVILPGSAKERVLLPLACSMGDLVFSSFSPKDLTVEKLRELIRQLAVDCIITNQDSFQVVNKATQTPMRPLKKNLITVPSTVVEPLPAGWTNIMQVVENSKCKYDQTDKFNHRAPVARFLSSNKGVVQYSRETLNQHLLKIAFWFEKYKPSRLMWVSCHNDIMSMAPWLFGSSVFYREAESFNEILSTFENYPIDTFCATSANYQMIENEQHDRKEGKIQLQQLFSLEPINPRVKSLWHSLTNLNINDNYAEFNDESMLKYFSKHTSEQQTDAHKNIHRSSPNVLYHHREF